jgi:hypothetical protein
MSNHEEKAKIIAQALKGNVKVRVIIPLRYYVSYILEVPAPTLEAVEEKIFSNDFDPTDWECDPDFYGYLWDEIKTAFDCHREDIEIEVIETDEEEADLED